MAGPSAPIVKLGKNAVQGLRVDGDGQRSPGARSEKTSENILGQIGCRARSIIGGRRVIIHGGVSMHRERLVNVVLNDVLIVANVCVCVPHCAEGLNWSY